MRDGLSESFRAQASERILENPGGMYAVSKREADLSVLHAGK